MGMKNLDPNEGKAKRLFRQVEEVFFATILLGIVSLGLTPIILRTFFNTGVTWTEPLTRQLVLWIALFGAGTATSERKHISIDILGHVLPYRWKMLVRVLTGTIAGVICGILTWVSIDFVRDEAQYASGSAFFLSVPEWLFELVLPVGFAILTLRFAIAVWQDAYSTLLGFQPSS